MNDFGESNRISSGKCSSHMTLNMPLNKRVEAGDFWGVQLLGDV